MVYCDSNETGFDRHEDMRYKDICKKIGFDPLKDGYPFGVADHEDDRQESPFKLLNLAELEFLYVYYNKHR